MSESEEDTKKVVVREPIEVGIRQKEMADDLWGKLKFIVEDCMYPGNEKPSDKKEDEKPGAGKKGKKQEDKKIEKKSLKDWCQDIQSTLHADPMFNEGDGKGPWQVFMGPSFTVSFIYQPGYLAYFDLLPGQAFPDYTVLIYRSLAVEFKSKAQIEKEKRLEEERLAKEAEEARIAAEKKKWADLIDNSKLKCTGGASTKVTDDNMFQGDAEKAIRELYDVQRKNDGTEDEADTISPKDMLRQMEEWGCDCEMYEGSETYTVHTYEYFVNVCGKEFLDVNPGAGKHANLTFDEWFVLLKDILAGKYGGDEDE